MASLVKQLLQPIAVIWVILIIMCGWQIYRRQFRWAYINGLLVLILFLFGSTPLSGRVLYGLERPYVRQQTDGLPSADAIVVLGGMLRGDSREPLKFNAQEAMDRILVGIDLSRKQNHIPLIVGGGSFGRASDRLSEFSVLKPWLDNWHLSSGQVMHLGICANTYEEARKTSGLMRQRQWKSIYLVTSAYHMHRAAAVFQTAGVKVIPVACDFQGYMPSQNYRFRDRYTLLPQANRLNLLRVYLHEKVGWLYYRSRGWIKSERE